jgi:predicted nucleic acid-binding protein
MLRMLKTIVSDTSCFIILANIGELDLLQKAFGEIITTKEVLQEFGEDLPNWVLVKSATDKYRQRILETQVDRGEASAIALALEYSESMIILDDYKARKVAENLGLEITGTIGVIIIAKKRGVINSIKPYLEKIRATNFRISEEIERQALKDAEE